jgi:uncharacterized protein
MADYKTPGVYVEEISTLPPSVGQVPTAVPAFIGYTAVASKNKKDLKWVPTHITSLLDYQLLFGGAAEPGVITVTINDKQGVDDVKITTQRYLYDSVRLFYANGGGECYIVSVGDYKEDPSMDALQKGLDALYAEDHPTMLVMPDAMLLEKPGECYALQQAMLKQCAEMQSRFAIFDVHKGYIARNNEDVVLSFRNGIGINHLNYGAAYYPWIQTVWAPAFGFSDVKLVDGSGGPVELTSLIDNPAPVTTLLQVMDDEKNILGASTNYFPKTVDPAEFDKLKSEVDQDTADKAVVDAITVAADKAKKDKELKDAKAARKAAWIKQQSTPVSINQAYAAIGEGNSGKLAELQHYADTIQKLINWVIDLNGGKLRASSTATAPFTLGSEDMKRQISSKIGQGTPLAAYTQSLLALNMASSTRPYAATAEPFVTLVSGNTERAKGILNETEALADLEKKAAGKADDSPEKKAFDAAFLPAVNFPSARNKFKALLDNVVGILEAVKIDAAKIRNMHDKNLYDNEPLYKSIVNEIQAQGGLLPPSGGIAGLYAQVDNQIGVWKAPANVSLASTNRPYIKVDDNGQRDLNVDVNAGKSINAIRSFQGKGTLVWGARTLAGNDNEWRYVSVRRTFIMIEQSVKASTFWAVFEPNDSRTWVKVKAMITNYLNNLWRQGALAGSTPEVAYFVNLGLGQTMTAVDILEGRMNIEIGLAVVRPAEFIILKFSHKMQEE